MRRRRSAYNAISAILPLLFAAGVVAVGSTGSALSQTAAPPKPGMAKPDVTPVASAGTSAVVMDLSAIESVIGKSVKSSSGEDLGRIVDLLVTTSGQVRAAVIDFGGILGVGSRKIAIDWKALDFANFMKEGEVRLALTRDQVRVSPEYKSGDPVVILQASKPDDQKPVAPPPTAAKPAQVSGASPTAPSPTGAPASPPQGEVHEP